MRLTLLLVRNTDKLELCQVFRLCFKVKFFTSVFVITAGVEILCSRFKAFKLCPEHIADIDIAFENLCFSFTAEPILRILFTVKDIAFYNVCAGTPRYIHCGFRIVCDAYKNMVRLLLRTSYRLFFHKHASYLRTTFAGCLSSELQKIFNLCIALEASM